VNDLGVELHAVERPRTFSTAACGAFVDVARCEPGAAFST
jgi:hypothetical protein